MHIAGILSGWINNCMKGNESRNHFRGIWNIAPWERCWPLCARTLPLVPPSLLRLSLLFTCEIGLGVEWTHISLLGEYMWLFTTFKSVKLLSLRTSEDLSVGGLYTNDPICQQLFKLAEVDEHQFASELHGSEVPAACKVLENKQQAKGRWANEGSWARSDFLYTFLLKSQEIFSNRHWDSWIAICK